MAAQFPALGGGADWGAGAVPPFEAAFGAEQTHVWMAQPCAPVAAHSESARFSAVSRVRSVPHPRWSPTAASAAQVRLKAVCTTQLVPCFLQFASAMLRAADSSACSKE